jgi:hypothetical protein
VSDVRRLEEAFASGTLLRPDAAVPNTVDLARAVAFRCGVEVELTANARAIADDVGGHDHLVFVLVDGLGMHLLDHEHAGGFLQTRVVRTLRAVFPTSTAPALTSIATGAWPSEHAVPGWFTYLPDANITAVILPFVERFSRQDAHTHGATLESAFPIPSLSSRGNREQLRVTPERIHTSAYSRYSSGDAPGMGYSSLRDACDGIAEFIGRSRTPTFTYFYVPFVDTAQHERGIASKATRRAMRLVESRLEELADRLKGTARFIVTADHGQIEVPASAQCEFETGDPLLALLRVPPSCEPRTPAFHVHAGQSSRFEQMFRERFGEDWALLTADDVDELRLLGPQPISAETRRRIGDYLGIALGTSILSLPLDKPMVGFHGGLQPDEVLVPLVIF